MPIFYGYTYISCILKAKHSVRLDFLIFLKVGSKRKHEITLFKHVTVRH